MRLKNSPITSLTFTETELILAVVSPAGDGQTDALQRFPYGFAGLKTSGAIENPVKMREFLEQLFIQNSFPAKTVVGIGLKYLDFKRLKLPLMPLDELKQIITDEATRESIFSFSNEPIAVSYCMGGHSDVPGSTTYDILAATTFREVINSYVATFNTKVIQLLAVKPLLSGFRETISQTIPRTSETAAFVKVTKKEAEFYVWQNDFPLFWRSLMVGADDPERLQVELITSLEHFKRRTTEQFFIEKLYVIGEKVSIQLDGLELNYLDNSIINDLFGLGVGFKQDSSFDFLNSSEHHHSNGFTMHSLGFALIILGLLGCNLWMALNVRGEWLQVRSLEKQLAANQSQVTAQKPTNGFSGLTNASPVIDWPLFLDTLRQIVPDNMRFERVEFGGERPVMTIEGLCMRQQNLDYFLKRVTVLDHVKAVSLIDMTLQEHSGLSMVQFKLTIQMEADHGQTK